MKQLIIASGNKGKIAEFQSLLQPLGYEVRSMADFEEIPEV
ncbi:MAG: non-canonical purine NTP pyrophosphatase, partial [Bacilli bacterium]